MKTIKWFRKRNGNVVPFDKSYIANAIYRAFQDAEEGNKIIAQKVTESVVEKTIRAFQHEIPDVEHIQDLVEETLIEYNFRATAKKYILYRKERELMRV